MVVREVTEITSGPAARSGRNPHGREPVTLASAWPASLQHDLPGCSMQAHAQPPSRRDRPDSRTVSLEFRLIFPLSATIALRSASRIKSVANRRHYLTSGLDFHCGVQNLSHFTRQRLRRERLLQKVHVRFEHAVANDRIICVTTQVQNLQFGSREHQMLD